ncbi:GNAT family N-acetyltransferase [Nocardia sp. NBC_00881]|uniref:GNAT family N-acetyltransferase n=1 Tax=Nocardia sp. NBC_00881 TaxID=2975995 RepID=UPI00387017D2|nr:GNAT family N-acetyltransferase [Nocardia sp. NBC_00881]
MESGLPPALAPEVAAPPRIDLGDILIRRWQSQDLVAQFEAITASFEHLHAWMPWLAEPRTLDQQREFNEVATASWPTADGDFNYGIFDSRGTLLGAIGLHDRVGSATLEIGYWCHIMHTGRGVITRSAAALTETALSLSGISRVEIHCDAANTRSSAVPRRIGYRLDRIVPREQRAPAESGRGMVWVTNPISMSGRKPCND